MLVFSSDMVMSWTWMKQLETTLSIEQLLAIHEGRAGMWVKPSFQRKTKIVCTIGPTSNTREMIWKLADAGMNVARLNMSHGDHASHKKVIDLVREFNAQAAANVIAIMLDTKGPEVRSGDLPQPIMLKKGDEFTFTIKRGVGTDTSVSVNYDDFVNDVEEGDTLLIDGTSQLLVPIDSVDNCSFFLSFSTFQYYFWVSWFWQLQKKKGGFIGSYQCLLLWLPWD
jgi:hypothetical protein